MEHINQTRRLRDLDRRFLERYDLVGPRYTSYPTAPHWNGSVGDAELRARLEGLGPAGPERPLSLYVHLPFCIERCAYCACNVIVAPRPEAVSESYVRRLEREASLWTAHLDIARPVGQLHWGGGTPTYLNADLLRRLHAIISRRFLLAPDAEQSIEIHVTWTTDEQLRTLADVGFNRVSMGVQDFNEATVAAIGRRQTIERTAEVINRCRGLGFKGINVDLIYGLPHQSVESFAATIDVVLGMRPDRLAVYNFAYLPGRMEHQRRIDPAALPSGAEKLGILLEAHDRLVGAGYRHIGMDHFALPGDELARAAEEGTMQRNFMGFTTRAGSDLVGMGVSAISSIDGLDAQNFKDLASYEQALEAGRFPIERGLALGGEDLLRRDVIQAIMCRDRIDKETIEQRHGISFDTHFAEELARLGPMVEDELLNVSGETIELTFLGRLFARNIAMVFDQHLARSRPVTYSRTL